MPVQKNKVTIFDVAKASGVSSSAVSYALNGKPGVSEGTRAKVLQVAHELGWKPNGAAQALAIYAGCMDALLAFYTRSGRLADCVSAAELPAYLGLFRDHRDTAASIARHFLEAGPGDHFDAPDEAAHSGLERCFTAARRQADAFIGDTAAASPGGLPLVWLPAPG